jgi:hypothetical protein
MTIEGFKLLSHVRKTMSYPRLTSLVLAVAMVVPVTARALEPAANEAEAIKACEQRLCTMALGKKPTGEDLKCAVSKTWAKDTLKKGESKAVKWGFGDARCAVSLDLDRAEIIAALTKPEHTINVPSQTVKCMVEREGVAKPVTAKLAPKLQFKDGKAEKIWINLTDLDGPSTIKATVWTAANLEDTLGIFHKSMIKSVNKFLYQRCGQRYEANGTPKPDPKEIAAAAATKAAKAAAKPITTGSTAAKPAAKPATPAPAKADAAAP